MLKLVFLETIRMWPACSVVIGPCTVHVSDECAVLLRALWKHDKCPNLDALPLLGSDVPSLFFLWNDGFLLVFSPMYKASHLLMTTEVCGIFLWSKLFFHEKFSIRYNLNICGINEIACLAVSFFCYWFLFFYSYRQSSLFLEVWQYLFIFALHLSVVEI